MSCGVGRRRASDPVLLWLWRRPVATAPIRPLAWELPYAPGVALKKKKTEKQFYHVTLFFCLFFLPFFFLPFLGLLPWHMEVPRLGVESEL